MNGIKMSECKFYVDEEARTVVCVIPNKIHHKDGSITIVSKMVEDFIEKNFRFNDIDFDFALTYDWQGKNLEMPVSFMGKAVCAPEDEWNEETGRLIAFSRAKDKCYKSFFKRANLLVQTVDRRLGDMITTFNDFGLKLDSKREALQKVIESQIKKEGDA
jgi:hypothetical protein